MKMPIVMKQDRIQLPRLATDAARMVVARNGVYVERRGPMFSTSIRMRPTDLQLDDHSQYCTLSCGKLPAPLHRVMLSFFLHAHRIHGGEAALVLLFHPGNRQYLWHCPEQTVDMHQRHDGWYVEDVIEFNNPLDLPEGYLHLGDAHLHPHSPHPSAIDKRDDQDGLHIIVGNITRAPGVPHRLRDGWRPLSPDSRAVFRRSSHATWFPRTPLVARTDPHSRTGTPRPAGMTSRPREVGATKREDST